QAERATPLGSLCSASSIEPITSANSTVTCFRSPSRVARPARIFSARCSGGCERESGAAIGATASATPGSGAVPARDPPQVDRAVIQLRVDPLLERNLAQRTTGRARLLDDDGRLVVADRAVERGCDGQRRGGGGGCRRAVDLQPVDASLCEHARGR